MIYKEFLHDFVPADSNQVKTVCPFHDDTDPSLYIKNTGQWFCFGCDEGGGQVKFTQKFLDVPEKIAQYIVDYYEEHKRLPIPSEEEIETYHQNLYSQPAVIDYLYKIGVKDSIIKKYKIGWSDNRLIFPIPSKTGYYVNLRKYMPPGSARTKHTPKTIHIKHLGHNRYYPYEAFNEKEIYIFEGEKDMIIARSQGLNAITSTGGRRIPTHEINMFKDKIVYIVVDTDNVGNQLALQYKNLLKDYAKEIHRIILPTNDFEDYWLRYQNTDIKRFIIDDYEQQADVPVIKLKESFKTNTMDAIVYLEGMKITGKHFNTYTLPMSLTINCRDSTCNKECPYKEVEINLDVEARDMLSFMKASDDAVSRYLKKQIGCKNAIVTDKQHINAQVVYFQEDITTFMTEEYYNQMQTGIYLFQDKPLQTNKTYNFKAIRTTDPKTQQMIFIILEAKEKTLSIDVNENELEYFRKNAEKHNIKDLMDAYYKQWTPHLEVFGRPDLFGITIFTYLSAIGFYWGNTLIKGWLDSLVIGDTRTGKSKLVKNFMKALGLGAYVSGENSRKTGIIGGIQKLGDNWSLSWGVVPLNDKRLAVIDEASGLSIEDIQELSQMRSEGILSITKIIAETTTARTRLLWITNPRTGKQLSDYYWKGVDALKEFLPVQEDLARFDLVTTAGLEDVNVIHLINTGEPMDDYMLNLWRQLVLFAWNLEPNQINLSDDIRKYIIDISENMGSFYKGLPLFLRTNGYEKLTRLAISIAILCFNYIDGKIVVTKQHVNYAKAFIESIYAKDSFRFKMFSEKENKEIRMTNKRETKVKQLFDLYENLGLLFESGAIRSYMIQEVLGIDKDEANKLTAELLKLRLIKITPHGYRATPQFLDYIRSVSHDEDF